MKNMMKAYKTLVIIMLLASAMSAQEVTPTITVTGNHVQNLSPNEIIIKVDYQEYFTSPDESRESKITIDKIEDRVLKSISSAGVKPDKLTMGSANFIQPNRNNQFKKGRISKALYLCIENTEEYIRLIQQLEGDGLFDKMIVRFSISGYNHTDKNDYLVASRSNAFEAAREKANLILSKTNKQLGDVITIKEINASSRNNGGGFYAVDNTQGESISGFQPIKISYQLEVVFEVVD